MLPSGKTLSYEGGASEGAKGEFSEAGEVLGLEGPGRFDPFLGCSVTVSLPV